LSDRPIGIVLAYLRAGFGWLDWNGERVWVHIQDTRDQNGRCLAALKVGQQFQFDVIEVPRGFRAKNARLVADAAEAEVSTNDHTV
jgi:cold shock CspA family protein